MPLEFVQRLKRQLGNLERNAGRVLVQGRRRPGVRGEIVRNFESNGTRDGFLLAKAAGAAAAESRTRATTALIRQKAGII